MADGQGRHAKRLVLNGRVQGLGVRPAIYRLATELGLAGSVQNTARGVEIEIEGAPAGVTAFVDRLPSDLPPGSLLERLDVEAAPVTGRAQFAIVTEPAEGPLQARVPADMAVCDDCRAEIANPAERRFRYSFTSCTACGPRYTIIRRMPYERPDTTMADFAFCGPCGEEYRQPGARRFHAQTNACGACGPRVWCVEEGGRTRASGEESLRAAVEILRRGKILALRGLGGYQLLVDATDDEAVRRLRRRKRRQGKPLAVMVPTVAAAAEWAQLDDFERAALIDRGNPILLVRARGDRPLAASVHPGFDTVGLMLPTTPLHAILADEIRRPLVCTSGNCEGDPLEYEISDAERRLQGVCDLWLHHDRPIARPIDDSVVRVIGGRASTIRLARGLAPLALDLPNVPPLLAVGGHFKSAVAWSNGVQAVLGPHIGDLAGIAARRRYLEQWADWQDLYRCSPRRLVHDLHPDYFSTVWAQRQTASPMAVQHHHAHVVAGMLQQDWLDRCVLGVAWDGTGYGADGSIWGGEFLLAWADRFERIGRLRPFPLCGGEAAIHEPWRVALALAAEVLGADDALRLPWRELPAPAAHQVIRLLDRPRFSPRTTSAGRLFDAAAAMILGRMRAEFEGQAAMMLEAVADRGSPGYYPISLISAGLLELDWRPLFAELLADWRAGADAGAMAMRFHRGLAHAIVEVCRSRQDLPVVLSGGVFQNRLLTELILEMHGDSSQRLGPPGTIPVNDGGLAAGQLAVAAALIKEQK